MKKLFKIHVFVLLAAAVAIGTAYAAVSEGNASSAESSFDTSTPAPSPSAGADLQSVPSSEPTSDKTGLPIPLDEESGRADLLSAERLPNVRAGELKFPVNKFYPSTYKDLDVYAPIDLKTPANISSDIEIDTDPARYIFRPKATGTAISDPYALSDEEYTRYAGRKAMQSYWSQKNAESYNAFKTGKDNSLFNFQFDLGLPQEIFGPGGVKVEFSGSSEISLGFRKNRIDNPVMSERMRNPPLVFDFNEKIQAAVNASVGDKVSFGLNYNTESSFDFDQQRIKLAYDATTVKNAVDESIGFGDDVRQGYSAVSGKSYSAQGADQILRKIEAGNVSMPLSSSLIRGSSSLFGIKSELQFGKLNVTALVSQQESESKTINLRGGAQTTPFEISADSYDENRHFFLSRYFYDAFNRSMSTLPHINSGITINRVEVWITNKRSLFEQARNIVAFADLGEPKVVHNPIWVLTPGAIYPANNANNLYEAYSNLDSPVRDIANVTSILSGLEGGNEYEKVESARKLESSEYIVNTQLGFISLRNALNSDEVLAVAYEYTAGGHTYQVGEFSSDPINPPKNLYLKLLKGTSQSPNVASWKLMMKNVYSLGGYQLQAEKFKLEVMYQSDSTGIYLNYIPNLPATSPMRNKVLLRALNLDRLDSHNEPRPDGFFDYVDGYTVQPATGRVIFPVVEPFGEYLGKQFNDNDLAKKYVFQELYDLTLTEAREMAEKNKFKLVGEYKSSTGSEIRLNAMNIPKGSVMVTAGGVTLTENVDYTVDYNMGVVNILNTAILESGTNVSISLENQSLFSMQRKTLLGTHLDYAFSRDFNVGATLMHLSEKPLTQKVAMGSEPISNTIWGLNTSYRTESEWITRMIDRLPLVRAKAPSSLNINAEFAQLLPGHSDAVEKQGISYIDDFEASKMVINIGNPYSWKLSSVPADPSLFPEALDSKTVASGFNRSLLAWYNIDPLFTRNNSTTPDYIRGDDNQQSSHFIREITENEIFPNRQLAYGESIYLPMFNLAYYPQERGPYNLDWNVTPDGKLTNPAKRWGGIMRRLETTDFETANIEYIEFWLMDPFVNDDNYKGNPNVNGGELYLNLGDVSEDILKDGRKSFENGLPTDGSDTDIDFTQWGRVSKRQSMVNAFDGGVAERKQQDVGLDGMNDERERNYRDYKTLVDNLRARLSAATIAAMEADPFSPLNDPASDNYHYYRGGDYDQQRLDVLQRYKYYNGLEGNSPASDTGSRFSEAATALPDVEDINQDNTLSEYEKYYQYRISLRPDQMTVGRNFITDKVTADVQLKNGKQSTVNWYQFKIPVQDYQKNIGGVRDFKSVRFIRMFLTGFEAETHLRFGTFQLVRGEWRTYNKELYDLTSPPVSDGSISVSAVNIEENSSKVPVNYVLPPGVSRVLDPSQPQVRQENEQAMMVQVNDLAPNDARAVYKNVMIDMRQYKRLQMFIHAEQMPNTSLRDDELTVFMRIGSDSKYNFYEYEIPLKLTPAGFYSGEREADRAMVWRPENMFDFAIQQLVDVKTERNRLKGQGANVSYTRPYIVADPNRRNNRITVLGNPSVSDVKTIMIGIRNRSGDVRSGEVWINELRLTEFNEDSGYAGLANVSLNLSDIGTVNLAGRFETAGFGGIEENVMDRRMDDYYQYSISTALELGRLFSENSKLKIPMYYTYSQEIVNPKYNPLDQDVLLQDALDAAGSSAARDSIKSQSQHIITNRSLNFSGIRLDIASKNPKIYDPANFSLSYSFSETDIQSPDVVYDKTKEYRGSFNYNYTPNLKPLEPFKWVKWKALKIVKDFNINYLPSQLAFNTAINRHYNETQYRTFDPEMKAPLSVAKDFTWDRNYDIRYDLSRGLKFGLNIATNARIDETLYAPVNRSLFPDEYENWKDTVIQSLRKGGRPVAYQQTFTASYTLPINKIPFLEWINATAQYTGNYNWQRSVEIYGAIDDEELNVNLGNSINSLNNWQIDGRFNFETLYNKSKFLREVNKKYASRTSQQPPKSNDKQPPPTRNQTETISLKKGEKKEFRHRLNSQYILLSAKTPDGKDYPLKYKVADERTIVISPKEDIDQLKITLNTFEPKTSPLKVLAESSARLLMMVRNGSISYKETNSTAVSGYILETGFLGQDAGAPGYGFAFGLQQDQFVETAWEKRWLMDNPVIQPVMQGFNSDLQLRLTLEPVKSLRIELNANRTETEQRSHQYQFPGMPTARSGSFAMSYIALNTAFWKSSKSGAYESRAYDQFLANRQVIANRLEQQYRDKGYSTGVGYNLNSGDVMIPAFLAAYTNRDAESSSTDIFPKLMQILPNWRLTYDGLSKLPFFQEHFRSVSINHTYQCAYRVMSYNTYLNWEPATKGETALGHITNVVSGAMDIPSSPYDVSAVSISERFNPLVGIDLTMKNNLTTRLEYRTSRELGLNMASSQIIEANSQEWVVGVGYRVENFDNIIGLRNDRRNKVKNDLTLRGDVGLRDMTTIIRKIDENYSQPSAGNAMLTLKFTADYILSERINLRAFYDYQKNTPFITTSYPTRASNYGVVIRLLFK